MPRQKRSHIMRYYGAKHPYLVEDLFSTARAAGSVNATMAEPGGRGTVVQNTRNVVDTGNLLSITGGRVVSAGRTGNGDPNIYYGPFTREGGLTAKCTFQWVTPRSGMGWTSVNNASLTQIGLGSYGGQLTMAAWPNVAGYDILASGVDYTVWATLFAIGGAVWVQGGAYTSPTLIWLENKYFATAGDMYFYPICTFSADSQIQADNVQIEVIQSLATPAQLASVYINIPVTGTNYTTTPDAINMFEFALPAVPAGGNKIELRYRYLDVNNYWSAYVIYNGGTSKWDFMVDEVLLGATTNKVTVADVGTAGATALRRIVVIVRGNSHYFFTDHTLYYERRGALVTDADLNTAAEVGAWFDAGTSVNLGSYPATWSL